MNIHVHQTFQLQKVVFNQWLHAYNLLFTRYEYFYRYK